MRLVVICAIALQLGCGYSIPPLPPEALAPRAVKSFQVRAEEAGITLTWSSPETDSRGKELDSLNGYRIYRKEIERASDITNQEVDFDLLATVDDIHVKVREERRAAARAEGKSGRTVQAPPELKKFQFTDSELVRGKTYLYKLVPFNQGSVEGEFPTIVSIRFNGTRSQITPIGELSTPDDVSDRNLSLF